MIRREYSKRGKTVVIYEIEDDTCAYRIVSELYLMGCRGKALYNAYGKLHSKDKPFAYADKEHNNVLVVLSG